MGPRLGQPKGSAITKAEIRVLFRLELTAKNRAATNGHRSHSPFHNRARDLDAESCGNGRLAGQTTNSESGAIFHSKVKIDPEVQKRDNESLAKQSPPRGKECPKDAGVIDLPRPQPFLNPPRDERRDSQDQY